MTLVLRIALSLALVSVAAYALWEIRRWRDPASASVVSARQKRLRCWGFFFLLVVLGLWLHGTYLPTPHTKRGLARSLGYWTLTALAIVPLIPIALLDARENLYRALQDRKHLRESLLISRSASEQDL